jgi:hypothetical protein
MEDGRLLMSGKGDIVRIENLFLAVGGGGFESRSQISDI